MTTRRPVKGVAVGVALLALAGCGKAVPDAMAADYAAREAVGSHLVNASTVPIAYEILDKSDRMVLAPGASFTGPGGKWATPQGWRCSWKFSSNTGEPTQLTGSDAFESWMTFGGYDETVVACGGPTP